MDVWNYVLNIKHSSEYVRLRERRVLNRACARQHHERWLTQARAHSIFWIWCFPFLFFPLGNYIYTLIEKSHELHMLIRTWYKFTCLFFSDILFICLFICQKSLVPVFFNFSHIAHIIFRIDILTWIMNNETFCFTYYPYDVRCHRRFFFLIHMCSFRANMHFGMRITWPHCFHLIACEMFESLL